MADVATRAGVSHQTVSRVLNHPDSVRPETRQRVERAIGQLGYRRNLAARALATQHSRLIGVLTPTASWFGPTQSLVAIEDAARALGYTTTAGVLAGTGDLEAAQEQFLDLGVRATIVVAPGAAVLRAAEALAAQMPVCVVSSDGQAERAARVVVDQYAAARVATRHLLDHGRRRVAHLAGPLDWFDAARREQGWRDELAGSRLPAVCRTAGWRAVEGFHAMQALLAEDVRPDAVFAANDLVALGAIRAASEAGLRVPEDLAVVGFDDVDGADQFRPPLTSMRQPFSAIGLTAMEQLGRLLEGSIPPPAVLTPQLVVRSSSIPPDRDATGSTGGRMGTGIDYDDVSSQNRTGCER